MTLETMRAVVDALEAQGVDATLEYPGFIQVGTVTYGDANDNFEGNVCSEDLSQVLEVLKSDIPSDSGDVERVAGFISRTWQYEPKLDAALDDAEQAFWREIVRHYPEATAGDLQPEVVGEFRRVARGAIQIWLENNRSFA